MNRIKFMSVAFSHALCIVGGLLCSKVVAQPAVAREDELKAAYLLNFAQFVEWPVSTGETLLICVAGADGVREVLGRAVEGKKKAAGRALAVRGLEGGAAPTDCNVLFMDAKAAAQNGPHLRDHASKPLLTVSDLTAFARHGGMIELFAENNRLRFNINVDNAAKAGLHISSSLLQLAAAIEKAGAQ
jgi:hypothetical protein